MARNDFCSNYLAHSFLAHHGILGQRWGVRRYQYEDGTLTEEGRKRYGVEGNRTAKQLENRLNDYELAVAKNKRSIRKNAMTNRLGTGDKEIYRKRVSDGEKEISKLLKEAKKAGYSVESEDIRKIVNDNEDRLQNAVFALMPYWNIPLSLGNAIAKRTFLRDQFEQTYKKHKVTDPNEEKGKSSKKKLDKEDGYSEEKKARDAAKAAGLDQGDNWKVYRDAQRGDARAKEAVKKWEADMPSKKSSKKEDAENYKKAFKEWNNAEQEYYWNTDATKRSTLGKRSEELARKEAAAQEALKKKGFSDDEIGKLMKEALKEDPSYHKYEDNYNKQRKSSGPSDKTIKSRVEYAKNTGKFDMEFLEKEGRYVTSDNPTQAELLRAYERYLKDQQNK